MPKYIKYRVSTVSGGNIAGDYKDYVPQKTEIINGMTVTYRMVDDAVYLASWEHAGQNMCSYLMPQFLLSGLKK